MFCRKCGANIPDDSAFCNSCGNSVDAGGGGNTQASAKAAAPTQAPGRSILVITGVIYIIFGAINFIVGILAGALEQAYIQEFGASAGLNFYAVLGLTAGVWGVVIGIQAIMHRDNLGKANMLLMLGAIALTVDIILLFVSLSQDAFSSWMIIFYALPIFYIVGAKKNRDAMLEDVQDNEQSPQALEKSSSKAKAIASVMAAILLISMTYGWISNPNSLSPVSIPAADGTTEMVRVPFSWHTFSDVNMQLFNITGGGRFSEPESQAFATVSTIAWIGVAISTIGFIAFLYFLHTKNKRAGQIGKWAFFIAAVSSLFFVGYMLLSSTFEYTLFRLHTPSIWAYLTIALGIVGFAYINIHKVGANKDSLPGVQAGEQLPQAQEQNSAAAAGTPGKGSSKAKAIASVMSAVLLISMTYGWISWPRLTLLNMLRSTLRWDTFSDANIMNFNQNLFATRAPELQEFATVSTITWIVASISIIGFIAFLYFMHTANKKAGRIGQVASFIAVISALFFVVYMHIASEGFLEFRIPSIWAYLTLVLGIFGFVYISKYKKEINSQA